MSALAYCPSCGEPLQPSQDLAERAAALKASLRADGFFVTPDGFIRSDALGSLLGGLTDKTLANYRWAEKVPSIRRAGRAMYALTDVVKLLDEQK